MELKDIHLRALARCAPDVLVRRFVEPSMPRHVVAIGKCAGAMLDGVAAVHEIERAFVAVPEGYRRPSTPAAVHTGGHPLMTPSSFAAGRALLDFVDAHDDLLFLVSGGGSACVEVPLPPYSEEEVAEANARLVASALPIAEINAERRKRSAIKGGKLRERVRGRCVTLVYSDVSSGRAADVASGPTLRDHREGIVVADNDTLIATAAELIGDRAVRWHGQIECDVDEAAERLARASRELAEGQILVAGGEPTLQVRGEGRGGRCSELALRFATRSAAEALFASSDGVDGNSGAAGIYLPQRNAAAASTAFEDALRRSDSFSAAAQVGEPIMIAPTGNNLRDLFLVGGQAPRRRFS